jgi:hypothetical protein
MALMNERFSTAVGRIVPGSHNAATTQWDIPQFDSELIQESFRAYRNDVNDYQD